MRYFIDLHNIGMTTYELRLATDCLHNNGVFRTMIFLTDLIKLF